VYFRSNVAGVQREWWYHRFGCEIWFLADRDTRTNEVVRVELPERADPEAAPDPVVPETPAV
jgi:sarcosine oxidase delta subunit